MMFGFLGVEFFFVLSGFLMCAKASREDSVELGPKTVKFLKGKICTIFPYYFVAWIIAFTIDSIGIGTKKTMIHVIQTLPALLQINIAGFRGYQVLGPTWYLSAMFLSMLLLFPLLLRYRKTFTMVFAPIISVFLYGYLFLKVGNLATINPLEGGAFYTGLFRGLAGISLGCICYECTSKLSSLPTNRKGEIAFAIIELLCFGLAIQFQRTHSGFRPDFVFLCLISIGITFAFCKNNALTRRYQTRQSWLGRFSLCVYLVDAPTRALILRIMPEATRDERLLYAFGVVVFFALIAMILGGLLKYVCSKTSIAFEKIFLFTSN